MKNIAILGFGVVGCGVAEVIAMNKDSIAARLGEEVQVKKILDIREFPDSPFAALVTNKKEEVFEDPEISIVVETIGGARIAYEYTKMALSAGKTVITSNKELVSTHGVELLTLARENHCKYIFEASVGGGIPIIRPLKRCLAANKVERIVGIVNGTTNYILTKMTEEGASYEDVLRDAQEKGFAEKDPTADVDGIDAANKLSILIALLFDKYIAPMDIPRCGIRHITQLDIGEAEMKGEKIKLIAHAVLKEDGTVKCSVKPEGIPKTHPLAGVSNEFNAVYVVGDMVGETMFYGKGAGALPTGSAIVGDILSLTR